MDDLRLWGHTSAHRTFGPTAGFRFNGFQGPLPLAEFQEAEPLGGVSGRSPAPSPARAITPPTRRAGVAGARPTITPRQRYRRRPRPAARSTRSRSIAPDKRSAPAPPR